MKNRIKIFLTISMIFISMFCVCSLNVHAEEVQRYTDTSGIREDLSYSNLNISDYPFINDSQFNKYDVILLTEAVDTDNHILNYIYVYNPFRTPGKYNITSFNYLINDCYYSLSGVLVDTSETISKYRVRTELVFNDELSSTRNYNFESIVVDGAETSTDFGAVISQNGQMITQEFDGYIFITGKDLIEITPIEDVCRREQKLYSLDGSEYYNYTDNDDFNNLAASLFFLNFDTNKEIDKINEIDLKYKMYRGKTDYDYMSDEYHSTNQWQCEWLYLDYTKEHKIISKEQTSTNYNTIKNQIDFKYNNTMALNLKSFYVTEKDGSRYEKFPELFKYMNMNQKLESGLTWEESFSKRQCSLIVDVAPVYISTYWVVAGNNSYYYKFRIEDLSVVRINFTTDGVTYNLKCNSGDPIDSETQDGPGYVAPPNSNDDNNKSSLLSRIGKIFGRVLGLILFVFVFWVFNALGLTQYIGKFIGWLFKMILYPFKWLIKKIKKE